MLKAAKGRLSLRRKLCEILEHGSIVGGASRIVCIALVLLIIINPATAALETIPELETRHRMLFNVIEYGSLVGLHRRVRATICGSHWKTLHIIT